MSLPILSATVMTEVAAGAALVLGIISLIWNAGNQRRVNRLLPKHARGTLEETVAEILVQAQRWQGLEETWEDRLSRIERQQGVTVSRVGLVRFNPFEDTGADLSFSLALLNDGGDGIVLTSLWGRDEVRVYAKPVTSHKSAYALSNEEKQAMDLAASRRIPQTQTENPSA